MTGSHLPKQAAADLADADRDPEPALGALRALRLDALDRVVGRWLGSPGFPSLRREAGAEPVTYALGSEGPGSRPDRLVRVHRRRSALQAHHVEAFLGALCRRRIAEGLLVTTGPCAPEALRLAQALTRPRVRVVPGSEWLPELCSARAGVRHGNRAAWIFEAPAGAPGKEGRW